jgi:two-component system, OmpR family, response regulator MprA
VTRVVVVEDEPDIRDALSETLADEGYEVVSAADGAAALSLLNGRLPDIAVVDLMMPGMDGYTFLRECRAHPRGDQMRVVLITASSRVDQDVEVEAVLVKPFDLAELVETLARLGPA